MHEKLFFDNRGALDPVSQHSHLEKLLDSFLAHRAVVTEECVPPALVLERGSCTLHVRPHSAGSPTNDLFHLYFLFLGGGGCLH